MTENEDDIYEKPPPDWDFFYLEELTDKYFKDYPENWMFTTDEGEEIHENRYCSLEFTYNNFNNKPSSLIQVHWEVERWQTHNSFPHLTMNDALDYFVRQFMLKSFDGEYRFSVHKYFNDEIDFKLIALENDVEDEHDEKYRSFVDRHIEILVFKYDEHTGDLSLRTLVDLVINAFKDVIRNLDLFQGYMSLTRKKYLERVADFSDLTLPYLLSNYKFARTNDEKGKSLEELVAFFMQRIEGFHVRERVRTNNEEIDLVIFNESDNSPWNKESQFILVECKNWKTQKVDKNEYVSFSRKLENRGSRANVGIFISSSGYTEGFHQERIRDSRNKRLIIDINTSELLECLETGVGSAHEFLKEAYIRSTMI